MLRTLYLGSSSACFELDNLNPYYSPAEYEVLLEGTSVLRSGANVFSLFDLKPDTDYSGLVRFPDASEEFSFHTAAERCCLDVRSFGALGDGVHEDTGAIQAAINALPDNGRLYFPKGTYLTLPLHLRSHITLELAEGAVLLGVTDRERYPILPAATLDLVKGTEVPLASFEGQELNSYASLIQGSFCRDLAIVGKGRIDGDAQNGDWWKGFENFPASRPRDLFLNRCEGVTLHGVTVANSPSWHIHPFYCKDVSLLDLFITAPKQSPNTDAIDPESCDGVRIIGCRFSVGDDCIAIKSGKIDLARKYQTPASHHTIRNCLMEFGHGAVTLGSELSGGIRELEVSQCRFHATDRGLRIKTRRGRGKLSVITGVRFDNIRMDQVLTPIVINMWYNCCDPDRYTEYVWSREHLPIDERTPHLGSFHFSNMVCTGAEVAACYIDGLPESPIDKVEIENVSVSFNPEAKPGKPAMQNFAENRCRLGLYLDNIREVSIRNVTVSGAEGEPLLANHCDHITTEGLVSQ
ncbi:MAG: glycoside hydrolase family 28 protein [Oscillospiraceae bacterium]|nr:glycoside hydrolase family 28 protein [Oscillospiraceae bacterium]